MVKKLSPLQTYFSLVKGFIAIGILYSPKNFRNAGWLWGFICMLLSLILTLVCLIKLIQARNATGACLSFSEIAFRDMGKWGKWAADFFMVI